MLLWLSLFLWFLVVEGVPNWCWCRVLASEAAACCLGLPGLPGLACLLWFCFVLALLYWSGLAWATWTCFLVAIVLLCFGLCFAGLGLLFRFVGAMHAPVVAFFPVVLGG